MGRGGVRGGIEACAGRSDDCAGYGDRPLSTGGAKTEPDETSGGGAAKSLGAADLFNNEIGSGGAGCGFVDEDRATQSSQHNDDGDDDRPGTRAVVGTVRSAARLETQSRENAQPVRFKSRGDGEPSVTADYR